jgi:dienelactone hydrolase
VRGRRLATLVIVLAVALGAALIVRPAVTGLAFVIRAADMHGALRSAADLGVRADVEREIDIPSSSARARRARVYVPGGASHRAVVLTSGLHPAGIDEPRLVGLARQLAASGVAVFTPDIAELSHFDITPAITDRIEDSALWLASQVAARRGHEVGLVGISFSGGLSVVAAGRPALANRVAFVFSFGGHDDLPRVLRYLCTGTEPLPTHEIHLSRDARDAVVQRPHDYGVAVILLGVADRVVPAPQVEPLREAVRRFLWASHLDRVNRPEAEREFAALRDLANHLPQPSATLLRYVNDRDVIHLGARLLPWVGFYGDAPALSPSRSPKPAAPVFLLHGIDDNVIPAVESEYLAAELRGRAPVKLLLSGLISHAEADQPVHVGDVLDLAGFWGDLLAR